MKYLVMLGDGMADYPVDSLNGGTPMSVADKPVMDLLARDSLIGKVSNVPEGMVPESDTANMAVMSFDPKIYSKGRSPLEAVSMGIKMNDDETAFRCNVVTLSEEDCGYSERTMIDHSSDEIPTEEADVLIKAVQEKFGDENRSFHTGFSYRHCLIWKNAPYEYDFSRPHDILGKKITDYVPKGEKGRPYYELMKASYDLLENHPLNISRRARGLKPANSLWLWSPGKKPALPDFEKKWGIKGAVVCAVDLIKGIGLCAGMKIYDVEGATGNVNTNYAGKAEAAIKAFRDGCDFVYVHVEAPDECGHRGELENKILSIELIDKKILSPVFEWLKKCGDDFKILVLPDHPTPLCLRTHSSDPVPFLIWSSVKKYRGADCFCEKSAGETGLYIEHGYELLDLVIEKEQNQGV